jgi:WD40-like Beta Propeller Repeat
MPGKARRWVPIAVAVAAFAAGTWWAGRPAWPVPEEAEAVPRLPRISPDYAGIVLPPNIAPLNFLVGEDGQRFSVRIRGEAGEPIEVASRSPAIAIPPGRWRQLLDDNRGKDLQWEVFAEVEGKWRRYEPLVNHVAEEEIDGYLVYRLISPVHNRYRDVGIYQRNLATYEESAVLDGKPLGDACVNCHSFAANDPKRMLVGVRAGTRSPSLGNAALLVEDGRVTKLGTPFGYTAFHPSGRIAAYSTSKVRQFFHTAGDAVRDVIDLDSSLAYFRVDGRQSRRVPGASNERQLATYPAWSPDGRWLYYCRAPVLWSDRDAVPPARYAEVKYSLMRMPYDIETDQWGAPETVLSAEKIGLSILLPRISPDGRFLLFCMCRYGCFPVFQPSSDLYLMDLAKGTYAKCPINSESSESWHSWSSNSRWIAFSSKRRGGNFTRCYLSYVDETGQTHKPFVLPQSDPEFYDSFLKTVSVPELVTGPVPVSSAALTRAARSEAVPVEGATDGKPKPESPEPYR